MALTKREEIGSIEVLADGQIYVRTDTVIEEDGVELSRTYHRHIVEPGHNLNKENSRVKAVGNVVHTPTVKTDFAAAKAARGENV